MSVHQLKEKMMLEFRQTGKQPVFSPDKLEQFCKDKGAHLLFSSLLAAQTERRHTSERVLISKRWTVALLYQLCYGLSQQCNFLQVDNSVLLQSCSTSQAGLETQRSVGSGCHPQTIRRVRRRLVADFGKSLSQAIKTASDQGQQIVLVIDDFHIMKDAHRSTESLYMRNMCTAIVKIFPSVPAVRRQVDQVVHNPIGVSTQSCVDMIASDMNMIEFAKTYAESMPQWLAAVFFDPDMQRHRLETHMYA